MKKVKRYFFLLCLFLLLTACADSETYAPVTEISTIERIPRSGVHRVTADETLYEISWRYGLDYRTLAVRNRIRPPYTVQTGQLIALQRHLEGRPSRRAAVPKSVKTVVKQPEPNFSTARWIWPVQGKVLNTFSAFNKGINITGHAGEPIYASAAGKVVYCGAGLRGYGKLIIIKHNSLYLSAYAHNQTVFVKEGEWVKQGQKIAEMGKTGTNKVMLHFEIRRAGIPVNPETLLRT